MFLVSNRHCLVQKEDVEAMAGYLSLHQNQHNVVVKWTPNQLMNVSTDHSATEGAPSDRRLELLFYAITFNVGR